MRSCFIPGGVRGGAGWQVNCTRMPALLHTPDRIVFCSVLSHAGFGKDHST